MSGDYSPGDKVRVIVTHPPGHRRTPTYIRGKTGTIAQVLDSFANPEELAFGRDGLPKRPLYRVRFAQSLVWPDYSGSDGDTIDVELYEHWLESEETL